MCLWVEWERSKEDWSCCRRRKGLLRLKMVLRDLVVLKDGVGVVVCGRLGGLVVAKKLDTRFDGLGGCVVGGRMVGRVDGWEVGGRMVGSVGGCVVGGRMVGRVGRWLVGGRIVGRVGRWVVGGRMVGRVGGWVVGGRLDTQLNELSVDGKAWVS